MSKGSSIKRFVIMRHGKYASGKEGLTDEGIAMISASAPRIESLLSPNSKYPVFSSHSLRAVETAVVYAKHAENVLWIQSNLMFYEEHWSELSTFINGFTGVSAILIIAHFEHIKFFPPWYCKNRLGIDFPMLEGEQLGYGCGVLIDIDAKTCVPI